MSHIQLEVMIMSLLTVLALLLTGGVRAPQPEIPSQWSGRKVAYLGDSITDPGQLSGHTIYWKALETILGTESYVYAVSGMQSSHMIGEADKLLADHGQDVDAIMILIGTNDFERSVPLGEWYSQKLDTVTVGTADGPASVARLHREILYDPSTFRGRMNILLSKLKKTWPTKQIILLTPLHRAYAEYGPTNIQADESWSNANGAFIDDFVQAVKEAGNRWAVSVIDVNALSGLYPLEPEGSSNPYFYGGSDSLHPNGDGHRRLAYAIACQMLGLPVIPNPEGK